MGVKQFEDLAAWKLATELKRNVYALIDRSGARRDFKFCDQLRDAAASAPAAIAEGFGRYHHGEFSYLLGVAKASLGETKNHLYDGVDRGYWTSTDSGPLLELAERAVSTITKLLKYIDRTDAPGPPRRRR